MACPDEGLEEVDKGVKTRGLLDLRCCVRDLPSPFTPLSEPSSDGVRGVERPDIPLMGGNVMGAPLDSLAEPFLRGGDPARGE